MLSPARIVAVRPEMVVIRGSASTRPLPLCTSRFTVRPNESGVRVSGCRRRNGGGVPPSDENGVVSFSVVLTTGEPKLRPRFSPRSRRLRGSGVSRITSFCSTSSWSMRFLAARIEYGLPVSTSCVPLGGTVMRRSGACACSACVTVVAMSVADDDGAPLRPGAAALSAMTSTVPLAADSTPPGCSTGGPLEAAAAVVSSCASASAMRWCCGAVASTESALSCGSGLTWASRNDRASNSPAERASTKRSR